MAIQKRKSNLQKSTESKMLHYIQVTWLVITEVRSKSFGLLTERRH